METEKENKLSFLDLDHVVHTMEIRDDTHMTPMKIVQCLRAPLPPCPSTSKILQSLLQMITNHLKENIIYYMLSSPL